MNKDDPRVKEHLRRVEECKNKMIAMGIYLRSFELHKTDVQQTWRRYGWTPRFGNTEPPPAPAAASTSSTLVHFDARSAKGK